MIKLMRGKLMRFVAFALVVFCLAYLLVPKPVLILVINDLLMSAAAGVCIAYAPIVPDALASRTPTKGEFLGFGVFFFSLSVTLYCIASMIARDMGWPDIYNSAYLPLTLYCGILGALLHLWAPKVTDGVIPRPVWTRTGIVVTIGLFLSLVGGGLHASLTHPVIVQLR
jgi:hypothetical protein